METGLSYLMPAAFVAIIYIIFVLRRGARRKRTEMLKRVAEQFEGGEVEPGSLFAFSQLHFQHPNGRGRLRFRSSGSKNKTYWTILTLNHEQAAPALRVTSQGFFDEIATSLGGEDILIGQAGFDSLYRIRGGPKEAVQQTLDSNAQRCIRRLSNLREITLNASQFQIEVQNWLKTEDAVIHFINSGLDCYHAMLSGYSSPFQAMAATRGLQLRTENPIGFNVSGTISGVVIKAQYDADEASIMIRANWKGPQKRFHIVHKDEASRGQRDDGVDLGNPVLDRMICVTAQGGDPEATRAFLNQSGVADGVLPVVHGYRGSTITQKQVTLITGSVSAAKMGEAIDHVVAAVTALQVGQETMASLPKGAHTSEETGETPPGPRRDPSST
jgi:hypothetical protein